MDPLTHHLEGSVPSTRAPDTGPAARERHDARRSISSSPAEALPGVNAGPLAAEGDGAPDPPRKPADPGLAARPMARDDTVIGRRKSTSLATSPRARPRSEYTHVDRITIDHARTGDEIPDAGSTGDPPDPTRTHHTEHEEASVDPSAGNVEVSHTPWIDLAQQTVIGPASPGPMSTRPTSVPIAQDRSSHHLIPTEQVDHPEYPDQSYRALQSQRHPTNHQPPQLRTRNSNPSQNSTYSLLASRKSREFPSTVAGAKTVGSTPTQSPGLYSPSYARSKASTEDLEDIRYHTPQLHPTHTQPPIETHKLEKDVDPISGNKSINNYRVLQRLGNGQHGTVKLAKNTETDELVAIKIVRRFAKRSLRKVVDPNELIRKEVAILKKARHPHVVSLLEVIDDVQFRKVYLILEFVALGEIVWRKQTVKDVAVFEMGRVRREKTGLVDPAFEVAEIEKFNGEAIARRSDKARVVRQRKQEAGHAREPSHWSLEFGAASEDGQGSDGDRSGDDQGRPRGAEQDEPSDPPVAATPHEAMGVPEGTLRASESLESIQSSTPKAMPWTAQLSEPPPCADLSEDRQSDRGDGRSPDRQSAAADTKLRTMITDFIDTEKEWTSQEDEYRFVACLTISQARDAFRDTVLGLEYLHYQGIIHRDIKPANLLWTKEQRVKISDFGVSYLGKPIRDDDGPVEVPDDESEILDEAIELAKTRGTPAFYAPELCDPDLFDEQKTPVRPQITGQIDVWSLGVTLYCMIFGRLPFIDESEMAMYTKIAHEEVFIPHVRLKAVEDSARAPMGCHKRLDDLVEYEDVGEALADLLRRLLDKNPTRRITLKEVKHHPWVLQGIQNQALWVDETDPSVQSQGKKIEVSTEEVEDAVVGLSIRDFVKSSWNRVNSVLGRGRDRKRGDRRNDSTDGSHSKSTSKTNSTGQESRRASLRDVDLIPHALRASRDRDPAEHPLAQSQNASAEDVTHFDDFDEPGDASHPSSWLEAPSAGPDRLTSHTESTRTIRPPPSVFGSASNRSSSELITSLTSTILENSQSSFSTIFGGTARGLLRSRDRGSGRNSPSRSSRASSVDLGTQAVDDQHGAASIALSSASAAGLMDQPPALRADPPPHPPASVTSSPSRPRSAAETNSDLSGRPVEPDMKREALERATIKSQPAGAVTHETGPDSGVPTPTDPPGSSVPLRPDPRRSEDDLPAHVEVSSSSEQIASGGISDQCSHPSMLSVTSGASSASIAPDDKHSMLPKMMLTTADMDPRFGQSAPGGPIDSTISPRVPKPSVTQELDGLRHEDEDAGYSGGGEQDSDSDDGGLIMG